MPRVLVTIFGAIATLVIVQDAGYSPSYPAAAGVGVLWAIVVGLARGEW